MILAVIARCLSLANKFDVHQLHEAHLTGTEAENIWVVGQRSRPEPVAEL